MARVDRFAPRGYGTKVKLYRNLDEFPGILRGGAVAIGNFDGVHRGHARIIERLRAIAVKSGGPAVVFTFDPHPVRLLRPDDAPPPLTWTDRKADLLAELGVDAIVSYPTDEALLNLTAEEFFRNIVCERLGAVAMAEGPNFRFGHARAGDIRLLATLTASAGIHLDVVEPVSIDGEIVSSSRVRRLISIGEIERANRLLTQPYRIRGLVVHGAGRGNTIGFPTANIDGIDTLLPAPGVYAGTARIQTESRAVAINIGPNPTFGEQWMKVEAHVIDWRGPLYGTVLEVDFRARLRDIQRFSGADALKLQLACDVNRVKRLVDGAT
jgi:riboflavin kinase/FMN adenylyltransferase